MFLNAIVHIEIFLLYLNYTSHKVMRYNYLWNVLGDNKFLYSILLHWYTEVFNVSSVTLKAVKHRMAFIMKLSTEKNICVKGCRPQQSKQGQFHSYIGPSRVEVITVSVHVYGLCLCGCLFANVYILHLFISSCTSLQAQTFAQTDW